MNIKVIGTGCEKCDQLYANVQEALKITGMFKIYRAICSKSDIRNEMAECGNQ